MRIYFANIVLIEKEDHAVFVMCHEMGWMRVCTWQKLCIVAWFGSGEMGDNDDKIKLQKMFQTSWLLIKIIRCSSSCMHVSWNKKNEDDIKTWKYYYYFEGKEEHNFL